MNKSIAELGIGSYNNIETVHMVNLGLYSLTNFSFRLLLLTCSHVTVWNQTSEWSWSISTIFDTKFVFWVSVKCRISFNFKVQHLEYQELGLHDSKCSITLFNNSYKNCPSSDCLWNYCFAFIIWATYDAFQYIFASRLPFMFLFHLGSCRQIWLTFFLQTSGQWRMQMFLCVNDFIVFFVAYLKDFKFYLLKMRNLANR